MIEVPVSDFLAEPGDFERPFCVVDRDGKVLATMSDPRPEDDGWKLFADEHPPEHERVWVHPEQWVAYRSGDIMMAPHNGHYVDWDVGAEGTATHWRYLPEDPIE